MTSLNKLIVAATAVFCLTSAAWADQKCDYPVTPVKFTDVRVSDSFWRPRLDAARDVTIPDCFQKCEPTRIPNFARAAGLEQGPFKGIYYDDSDVYKIIEGASYVLALENREGNGTPLQYSCLENPMDGGVW